jgi:hypothetical protein
MPDAKEPKYYDALALPDEALAKGGHEILRAGIIKGEVYVSARRAFQDPAKWGEILAEVTGRLAALYAAATPGLSKKDARVAIAETYVAEMGARPVKASEKRPQAKARGTKRRASKKPSRARTQRRKG